MNRSVSHWPDFLTEVFGVLLLSLLFVFIEVELIYNVLLISDVQHSHSYVRVHIYAYM